MPVLVGDFYRYVFDVNAALIDVTKVPDHLKKSKHDEIAATIRAKFDPMYSRYYEMDYRLRKNLRKLNCTALEEILYGKADEVLIAPETRYIKPVEKLVIYQYDAPEFPNDLDILKKFIELNEEYHYFDQDDLIISSRHIVASYKMVYLYSKTYESNVTEDEAYLRLYKLFVYFGIDEGINPFKKCDNFCKRYIHIRTYLRTGFIHELVLCNIPKYSPEMDIESWRDFIANHGIKALHIFQSAADVQRLLGRVPQTVPEANKAYSNFVYKKGHENKEMAELFAGYFLPEMIFNRCLQLELVRKQDDLLPDVKIDGAQIGHPNYYFIKLPAHDVRGYILGHITNCCQSIGGNAEACVIDGKMDNDKGFYVLLKKSNGNQTEPFVAGKINYADFYIVGQGFAWLSMHDNLVIDSWENLRPESENPIIVAFLTKFSEIIAAKFPAIERLLIGAGGRTPKFYTDQKKAISEVPKKSLELYSDTANQVAIWERSAIAAFQCLRGHENELNIPMSKEDAEIFDAAISSQEEADYMKAVFLDPRHKESWKIALGNNADKLVALLKSSNHHIVYLTLKILACLVRSEAMSEEILCYLLKNEAKLPVIDRALTELAHSEYLNINTIHMIVTILDLPQVENVQPKFSEENITLLMTCQDHLFGIYMVFHLLVIAGVTDFDAVLPELVQNKEHIWPIITELNNLREGNKLTYTSYRALMREPSSIKQTCQQLLATSEADILKQYGVFSAPVGKQAEYNNLAIKSLMALK